MPNPTQPFGWQFIDHHTFSSDAAALALPTGYTRYKLELTEIVMVTDSEVPFLRFAAGSGDITDFENDTSDYEFEVNALQAAGTNLDDETSQTTAIHLIPAAFNLGNVTDEFFMCTVWIDGARNTALKTLISWLGTYIAPGGELTVIRGGGKYTTAETNEAVQIVGESAAIATGGCTLFGLNVPSS